MSSQTLESFFGDCPWAVLFVEADLEAVSVAYEKYLKLPLQRNVSIRSGPDQSVILPGQMVVKVRDSDWVCVMHGYYDGSEVPVLSGFRHRVLEFAGTDDGCVNECNLCVPFQKPIRYRTRTDACVVDEYFEAAGHTLPSSDHERVQVDTYEQVFREYGIRPVLIGRDAVGNIVASEEESCRIACVNAVLAATEA